MPGLLLQTFHHVVLDSLMLLDVLFGDSGCTLKFVLIMKSTSSPWYPVTSALCHLLQLECGHFPVIPITLVKLSCGVVSGWPRHKESAPGPFSPPCFGPNFSHFHFLLVDRDFWNSRRWIHDDRKYSKLLAYQQYKAITSPLFPVSPKIYAYIHPRLKRSFFLERNSVPMPTQPPKMKTGSQFNFPLKDQDK